MTLSTVYLWKYGIIVYKANAGFGVSTVDESYARARLDVPLCTAGSSRSTFYLDRA